MKVRYLFIGIAIIVSFALLVFYSPSSNQFALISYAFTLDERGQLPGEFTGKSTAFDIQRSTYRNISVAFDTETQAHIQSITGMVGMRITPSQDTLGITISNLEPNTTYYKYVDHLDNLQEITTDETGSVTFNEDTSQERYLVIFTHPSTYFIEDDSTGRDCNTIGTWNGATKTCTLTQNLTKSIEIKDNDITLDGDNHTIQGPDSNIGIYVNGGLFGDITDVTVKNITVKGFSKGMQINNTQRAHLVNVTAQNNADGVEFYRAETSSITGSTITGNTGKGLIVGTSSDINDISNNTINSNGVGIDLGLNSQSSITRNNIKLNGNGIAVSAIGGANTFLWQNKIDNTNQVSILFDGDTQFYKDPPIRGNFWADHACIQDTANNSLCTNRYLVKDRPILSDIYDEYPWACEDGWIKNCPVKPPTTTNTPTPTGGTTPTPTPNTYGSCTPGGEYAEVYNAPNGRTNLLKDPSPSASPMKLVPNGWVFHIENATNPNYLKVKDLGTAPLGDSVSVGFIPKIYVCTNPDRESEFIEKTNLYDTNSASNVTARKGFIARAAENYFNNADTVNQLYSAAAGRDGQNNFSVINTFEKFPHILLALARQETGTTNNNRICSGDRYGGIGIFQMTTPSAKGLGSNLTQANDSNYSHYFDDCYDLSGLLTTKGFYYTNTKQGIFAALKDGIRVLKDKYSRTINAQAKDNITATEMRFASAVYRYNQGSPFRTQLVYEAWSNPLSPPALRDFLLANGYRKLILEQFLIGNTEAKQIAWLQTVKDTCAGKMFRECLAQLTRDRFFTAPPLYLEQVGQHIRDDDFGAGYGDIDLGNKFIQINTSSLIMGLASPAEIQAIDPQGKRSGLFSGLLREEIPNTWYDNNLESLTLLYPDGNNKYRVVGTGQGTYDYVVIKPTSDNVLTFVSLNIPIRKGEIHIYSFAWNGTATGKPDAVTLTIDQDGDGTPEFTISADRKLSVDEFAKAIGNKVTLCHVPPGNPAKKYTINVGASALKAHLAHGDSMEECVPFSIPSINKDKSKNILVPTTSTVPDTPKIPPGQLKSKKK